MNLPRWARPAALLALALAVGGAGACGANEDVPGNRGELKLESNADVHQAGAPAGAAAAPISAGGDTIGSKLTPEDSLRIDPRSLRTGVTTAPNQTGAVGAPALERDTTPRQRARDVPGRAAGRRELPDAERPYPGRP